MSGGAEERAREWQRGVVPTSLHGLSAEELASAVPLTFLRGQAESATVDVTNPTTEAASKASELLQQSGDLELCAPPAIGAHRWIEGLIARMCVLAAAVLVATAAHRSLRPAHTSPRPSAVTTPAPSSRAVRAPATAPMAVGTLCVAALNCSPFLIAHAQRESPRVGRVQVSRMLATALQCTSLTMERHMLRALSATTRKRLNPKSQLPLALTVS